MQHIFIAENERYYLSDSRPNEPIILCLRKFRVRDEVEIMDDRSCKGFGSENLNLAIHETRLRRRIRISALLEGLNLSNVEEQHRRGRIPRCGNCHIDRRSGKEHEQCATNQNPPTPQKVKRCQEVYRLLPLISPAKDALFRRFTSAFI